MLIMWCTLTNYRRSNSWKSRLEELSMNTDFEVNEKFKQIDVPHDTQDMKVMAFMAA